jgi:hypothetical protein
MNEIVINNQNVLVKEYEGKRVVTFKDIDMVHGRPEGTAGRNFRSNRKHFIEGEDFFNIKPDEIRRVGITSPNGGIVVTESGYLMLAKSLTDDLSWDVQRQLVNGYFKAKESSQLSPIEMIAGIANNAVEMERRQKMLEVKQQEQAVKIDDTNRRLDNMVDVLTLDKNSWRHDSKHLISKIAQTTGSGFDCIGDTYKEVYRLVEERAGVSLGTRLTNKRNRMAGEGVCKSKRDKLSKVDVIADDKKLIEIYVAIVKEMAVKYGVAV